MKTMTKLYSHQEKAIDKMKNGCILCGDVGTGKSRTAIAYFILRVCASTSLNADPIKGLRAPKDLYIITTAKKRDSYDWFKELSEFNLYSESENNPNKIKIVVDSWNNIKKYVKIYNAFFIFDEQRVVGYGSWTKSFLNITRKNEWILLSATPGDVWTDYIPVFIANGFYRNKSEFITRHVIYDRFAKYPKIDRYTDTEILIKHRNDILVTMDYERRTIRHRINCFCEYDKELYFKVLKDRWDPYDNKPIEETGKLLYLMRKVVNSDPTRINKTCELVSKYDKAIIFYNFTYELNELREMLTSIGKPFSEWNGEKHNDILDIDSWVYLVQYTAGSEGWNCVDTNVIIFYSLNYSYRMTMQAEGRIDRLNTKYKDLYFYYIKSRSTIDIAISRALSNKKNFNERTFLGK